MKTALRENSALRAYSLLNIGPRRFRPGGRELHKGAYKMVEMFRSGAILFMGLTVIGAGVVVAFYG